MFRVRVNFRKYQQFTESQRDPDTGTLLISALVETAEWKWTRPLGLFRWELYTVLGGFSEGFERTWWKAKEKIGHTKDNPLGRWP